METIKNIFDPLPGSGFNLYWPLIIIYILMFGLSIWMNISLKKNKTLKKLLKKYPRNLKIISSIGILLLGARYQEIPYLSIVFIQIILLIIFIYTSIKAIMIYKKSYPHILTTMEHKKEENKYLPGKKTKKKSKK